MGRVRRGAGGFTLVELLVVVAILGVLSAVATFTVAGLFNTSNSTTCEVDAKHLTNAEDTVMAATGSYLSQPALLDEGYLIELSDRYDIQLDGTSEYSLVPTTTECSALPGAGVGTTTTTTTVNTAPPYVVEITKEGTDPTNADSVTWTVTFSESVTGVDAGDFIAIVRGALAGPSAIIGVAGEGASYTVTASTGTGNGTLGLNVTDNDSIVNLAGVALGGPGAGNGHAAGPAFTIDTAAPSVVSVELVVASPTNAASVSWTVTFSESVTGVDIADFALVKTGLGGTSAVTNVAGGGAVYTVTASTGSGTGTLGLNVVDNDSIADVVTNKLGGVGNGNGNFTGAVYTIDRTFPTVTGVSSPLADGTYGTGQVVPVTVTFSEPVTVTGTPRLTLSTESPATTAVDYASGSGAATLTFDYAVVAGNASTDLNYTATNSLALNGGTIRDAAANNATLTLPAPGAATSLGGSKAIVIDGVAPVVTLTVPANSSSTGDTTPALSGAASSSDSPTVVVKIYHGAGTGGAVVQTINVTRSGAAWSTTAAALAGGTYTAQATQQDAAGNTGSSTANVFTIDTTFPTVSSIDRAGPSPTNTSATSWTVTFSESVTGVNTADFSVVKVGLGGTPAVTGVTGSGAVYTVTASTGSGNGTLGLNLADNDSIVDLVGNNLGGAGNGNGNFTGAVYTLDRTLPTVTGVSSPLANGSYKAGQVVPVTVTFSEPVTVTGTPRLTLATGSPTTTAVNYASGSGTATLTFNYVVVAGNSSADLNYSATTSLALNGGTIRDVAANNATLTLPATSAGTSLGGSKAIVIDTATPVVSLTVPANNAQTNDNTPTLSGLASNLTGDSPTVTVTIYSGSGTAGPVVQTIPVTRSGATWSTTAGALAVGTYTAQARQSDVALNTGSSTANTFTVDTVVPTVLNVSSPLANGTYPAGQLVPVTVTFSEPVTVTGTPRLTLSTGVPATTAVNYSSGSGTATLTFNYTVAAGNTSPDLDYAATTSLALNSGTIRDPATNNATLTLPAPGAAGSLGANKLIVIEATAPTPTALALANGPGAIGAITLGDTVTITYSEPLQVSSLCSTWTGDGSNQSLSDATVTITDGGGPGDDTISSVTSPTCTFNLGSVGLGSKFWLSNTRTFGATGTKSTVQWNATARTLTITLGTPSGSVQTGVGNVTPVYTPSTVISDPVGNTMLATAFNGTSSRF